MAIFNPSISPTSDPNYLGLSKPISQPDIDKTWSALFSGVSQVADTAIKGYDHVVKADIDKQAWDKLSAEREKYTQSLQGADAILRNNPNRGGGEANTPDTTAEDREDTDFSSANRKQRPGNVPINILDTTNGNTPPEPLEEGIAKMNALPGARANGKLSMTDYYARMDAIATSLRAQYPGYREYIDKRVQEITGVDPANARVKSLIGDINAATTGSQAERTRMYRYLEKSIREPDGTGLDPSQALFFRRMLDKGASPDMVMQGMAESNMQKFKIKKMEVDLKGRQTSDAMGKIEATQLVRENVRVNIDQNFRNIELAGRTFKSFSGIEDFATQVNLGKIPAPTEKEAMEAASMLRAGRDQLFSSSYKKAVDGGALRFMTPDELKAEVDGQLVPWDRAVDAYHNQNWGLISHNSKVTNALINQQKYNLVTDKLVGLDLQLQSAIQSMNLPEFSKKLWSDSAGKGMVSNVQTYLNTRKAEMAVQPHIQEGKGPAVLKGTIEELKRAGLDEKDGPKTYQNLIDWAAQVNDPTANDKIRLNKAIALYDPANKGVISLLPKDGRDSKGNPVRGMVYVYNQLASRENLETVKKLDKVPGGIGIWDMAREWTISTFANDIASKEIQDIEKATKETGRGFLGDKIATGGQLYKYSWNNKISEFELAYVGPPEAYQHKEFMARTLEPSRRRLNHAIRPLVSIAELEGKDPSTFVLQTLGQFGYSPVAGTSPDNVGMRVEGYPKELGDAIVNSYRELLLKKQQQEQKWGPGARQ